MSGVKDAGASQKALNGLNQTEVGLLLLEEGLKMTRVGHSIRKFSLDELPDL